MDMTNGISVGIGTEVECSEFATGVPMVFLLAHHVQGGKPGTLRVTSCATGFRDSDSPVIVAVVHR
jgi:hypothetical protein